MTTSVDTFPLNFLTFKSNGRTYIRAYRNTWVPKQVDEAGNVVKKAGSAPAEQHLLQSLILTGLFSRIDGILIFGFSGSLNPLLWLRGSQCSLCEH